MGYCLACGKLRDTLGGMCRQCREDARGDSPRGIPRRMPSPALPLGRSRQGGEGARTCRERVSSPCSFPMPPGMPGTDGKAGTR